MCETSTVVESSDSAQRWTVRFLVLKLIELVMKMEEKLKKNKTGIIFWRP